MSSESSDSAIPSARRLPPRFGWAVAFVIATVAMVLGYTQLKQVRRAAGTPALERYAPAPDFEFLAHDGTRVSTADLRGKVWVANFIFTRCKGPCPVLTARMARFQESLKESGTGGVRLLSFTVDPDYDSKDVLAAYAEQTGAESGLWKFLTGPKAQIENVIQKGFFQSLAKGAEGEPVHSQRFVVVDQMGWMRAFPDGNDPQIVGKLEAAVGQILREPPGPGGN